MESLWAKRFMIAAIIQGLLVLILTTGIVVGQFYIKPEASRVIAFGSAGTWFTMGYILYIVVGVIGVAVSALFYHYLEDILRKSYIGFRKYLAAAHLILMNAGVIGSTWLMMKAGYEGGKALLPTTVGGLGLTPAETHEILAPYIMPIAISIGILAIGILLGGIGFVAVFVAVYRRKTIAEQQR